MKIAITTTTINNIDIFLEEYIRNIEEFGHGAEVAIYIAGDRKSPLICEEEALKYRKRNMNVRFLPIKWQHNYLQKYKELDEIIPEDSDNRRNVAYLLALEEGAEVIISVDDDNFPSKYFDFVGEHSLVGSSATAIEAYSENRWFNSFGLLKLNEKCYPRGFPYKYRTENCSLLRDQISNKIAINVGLWTGDPDIDAIGRLSFHPESLDWVGTNVILSRNCLAPINTQNTALSRESMLAYYYVRMGETIKGMRLDRFGDVLSGYFAQLCVKAVGEGIKIGSPLTEHRRNPHNIFVDLYNELAGIMIIEDLATLFENIQLPSSSIYDAYICLSHELENFATKQDGFVWDINTKLYFQQVSRNMRIWADVVAGMG